jgi:flavin reductase like protein
MAALEFRTIEPKILYFGTPMALISSLNEDGATNLAAMSSFWALGWTLVLGVLDETKTAENLARHPECLVNVPSPELWQNVEELAPLTGKNPVPDFVLGDRYIDPARWSPLIYNFRHYFRLAERALGKTLRAER